VQQLANGPDLDLPQDPPEFRQAYAAAKQGVER
jgi:hypothetical protein